MNSFKSPNVVAEFARIPTQLVSQHGILANSATAGEKCGLTGTIVSQATYFRHSYFSCLTIDRTHFSLELGQRVESI